MNRSLPSVSLEKRQITISPEFLIEISNNIDMINHFYEQESLGSLSNEYRGALFQSFTALNQKMQIYESEKTVDASCMIQGAIIMCRAELELFCMNKVGYLLSKESEDLGKIIMSLGNSYRNNMEEFEKVLQAERRKRVEAVENDKDKMINKLKQELVYRKDYIKQIKDRLEQMEAENSKMYQKLIGNAKNVSKRALSPSPKKNITAINQSLIKIKTDILQNSSHKTLSPKQVEESIHDIMESKRRHESVRGKRVNLDTYMKTYFRNKFGVKGLAQQTEIIFREALEYFAQMEERSLFILFQKMIEEECEQSYFWEQRAFQEKITKTIKRYLNEKHGHSLDELDKYYDEKIVNERNDFMMSDKDVQFLLINIYKTTQIQSLQHIFTENLLPKLNPIEEGVEGAEFFMPSKKLINQILNYEMHRHLLKIEDTIRLIQEIDTGRGFLTYEEFQSLIIRLNIAPEKIQANMSFLNSFQNRFLTYTQIIESVEKLKRQKNKKK